MANLETLELTISANAESASQGIGQLTRSLSALSAAVGRSVSGLMRLNAELKTLKGYGKLKLPDVGKTTGASKAVASAKKWTPESIREWQKAHEAERTYSNTTGVTGMIPEERMRKLRPEWYQDPEEQRKNALAYLKNNGGVASWAEDTEKAKRGFAQLVVGFKNLGSTSMSAFKKIKSGISTMAGGFKESVKAAKETANEVKKVGEEEEETKKKSHQLFTSIGRIFKTMLIRTAIRALIKSFTEAWNKAYEFSKKMKGSFAESIDKIKGSLQSMAVNIIRAFAPLMQVVAPIISVIATGVKYLTDAIINLMKLLGVASDMFGATAEQIIGTGDASKKASKEIVANFDELNVIGNNNGSSGGSSGSNNDFLKGFKEEIDAIKIIVAESLLAVGLLLAFSGHPAIGLALAAVGAATIVGTITEKWGTMAENVKAEITEIMTIAGLSMLAIGCVLAFAVPTKRGLGIALIAAGVANLVTAVSLSWTLSDDVKAELTKITAIAGGSLLAIGAIIALAVPGARGLGIGMMIAGGVSLASAVALNWNSLKETVVRVFEEISKKISTAWETVKTAVGQAWDKVLEWLGIDKEGLTKTWDEIKTKLVEVWENIKTAVFNAFVNVKMWALEKWESFKTGWENIRDRLVEVWNTVKDAVFNAFVNVKLWALEKWASFKQGWEDIKDKLAGVWNTVKEAVFNAYVQVQLWIQKKWSDLSENWEKIKTGLAGVWDHVKEKVHNAYINVVMWAQKKWSDFSTAWNDIRDKLADAWNTVSEAVMNAYVKVVMWVQKKWSDFSSAWDKIKEGLKGVWDTVKEAVEDAWKAVGDWLDARWSDISQAWEDVKTGLSGIWEGIKKAVQDAWDAIINFNPLEVLKQAWNGVIKWFTDKIVNPIRRLFGMEEIQIEVEEVKLENPNKVSKDFSDSVLDAAYKAKKLLPDLKIDDYIKISNWQEMKLDQKLKFLDFLKTAYGNEEAKNAVKSSGLGLGQALQYGMQSKEPELKRIATEWADLIKQKTESKPPVITPSLNQPATNTVASNIQRTVQGVKPTVTPNLSVSYTDIQNDIVEPIESATATTKVEPELDKYAWDSNVMGYIRWEYAELTVNTELNEWSLRQNVLWPIEDCDPKITVSVDSSGVYTLSKSLKNALSSTIKLKLPDGTYVSGVKIIAAATGGLFDSGDLFIANEDGTSEMVGRFGNQTGVANQQEIISGIRKGVADANTEQNTLLREQNKLLMGILNKESTVQIGASSMLGRTVQQSLNMYNAVTGRA